MTDAERLLKYAQRGICPPGGTYWQVWDPSPELAELAQLTGGQLRPPPVPGVVREWIIALTLAARNLASDGGDPNLGQTAREVLPARAEDRWDVFVGLQLWRAYEPGALEGSLVAAGIFLLSALLDLLTPEPGGEPG